MKITKNLHKVVRGADALSLGISMVVAVVIGVVVGYYFKKWTGVTFLFWLFTFIGIAAAFLNFYKSYKIMQESMKELENDPKYKNFKPDFDDDEEDEWAEK